MTHKELEKWIAENQELTKGIITGIRALEEVRDALMEDRPPRTLEEIFRGPILQETLETTKMSIVTLHEAAEVWRALEN